MGGRELVRSLVLRPATVTDVEAIAGVVIEGDETFAEFAPAGWKPPTYEMEVRHAQEAVASEARRTVVAVVNDEVVGYTAWVPASLTRMPADEPGLAHLGRLFVLPSRWGAGVATALHADAVAAAAAAGFTAMRLFTPTGQSRARRFYEREGWHAVGHLATSQLGLPLTEYRRALASHQAAQDDLTAF